MFSGIGGFELGIQRVIPEAECIGYSEIDKHAINTYKKRFGGHKNYGDATKINTRELPDFDFLVGGFPCQAFSIAGKRRGFEDTRGTLFFDIARIIKAKQPRMFLLENVKGLLNHDKGETFTTILKTIDELGYDAEWQVLNSKHFGVPQNRERVFIIGHLRGTGGSKVFPLFGTTGKNLGKAESEKYILNAHWLRTGEYGNGWSDKAFTMDSGVGRDQLVQGIRRLTPKECERLQGFPDDWTKYGEFDGEVKPISDTQRYKMCGNAVTTNMIAAIIEQLMTSMDNKEE